jgi:eukaryotic sulfide quinone oxidoreductase
LKKTETQQLLQSVLPKDVNHIAENVQSFQPEQSTVTTTSGRQVAYEQLIVAPGLQINWDSVSGLSKALADSTSGVSSIYSYTTCDKVWSDVDALRSGNAIFTQPTGIIKCAGGKPCLILLAI